MKNFIKAALATLVAVAASHASAQNIYDCTLKLNGFRSALSSGTQPGYNLTSGNFAMSERLGTLMQASAIAFTYTGSSTDAKDQDALYGMTHSTIRVSGKFGTGSTGTGSWTMDGVKLGDMPLSGIAGGPSYTGVPNWSASSAYYRSTSNSLSCVRRTNH